MDETLKIPHQYVGDHFKKYLDQDEVQEHVKRLAQEISRDYGGQKLILIGVLKGCLPFLADLSRQIEDVNISYDFVKLKSISRSKEHKGTIGIDKDISVDVLNQHVLIAEEIIDIGRAHTFLKDRIALSGPKSLKTLTLFDKPYQRKDELKIDYCGLKIKNEFVIGYGMDLEEYGRNIKDLYYLKYPN
jgi:hypoxanthine phosphoribosyltransferase